MPSTISPTLLFLGFLAVIASSILPLSDASQVLPGDSEDQPSLLGLDHEFLESKHSPTMRRLTFWRWGRRSNDKEDQVTTESPTTTEKAAEVYSVTTTKKPSRWRSWFSGGNDDEEDKATTQFPTTPDEVILVDTITTTEKPSKWRSWFSRAKEKISQTAKKVKTKLGDVKDKVNEATKNGFYKAGKAIVLGVRKVGNVTRKAGRVIKKGAKKFGSAVKSGYQKIKLKFSGPDEKFKILANRIKDKLESGDERAVELLKKIGIHITFSDKKVTGSHVVNKNISVTEVLRKEGMLSNKTASSYHTALEEPEITALLNVNETKNDIAGSEITGLTSSEDDYEFHSAEEYLTSEPNITMKVEYERSTTHNVIPSEASISATNKNDTENLPHLEDIVTESSTQPVLKHDTVSKTTDSISTEDSSSSITDTPASSFYPATMTVSPETSSITSFSKSTKSSLTDHPTEKSNSFSSISIASPTDATSHTDHITKHTFSTAGYDMNTDIDPVISVNTIHPLYSDLYPKDNSTYLELLPETSTILEEYEKTLSTSTDTSFTQDLPFAINISFPTSHDTSILSSSVPGDERTTATSFDLHISPVKPSTTALSTATSSTDTTTTTPVSHLSSISIDVTFTPQTTNSTETFLPSATATSTLSPTTTSTIPSTTTRSTTSLPSTTTQTTTFLPSTTTKTTTTSLPSIPTLTATTFLPSTTTTTTTSLPSTTTPTTTTFASTTLTTTTLPSTTTTTTTTSLPSTTTSLPTTTTASSTIPLTTTIKAQSPTLTTKAIILPLTPSSTSVEGDTETVLEEAYVPPPFPDVFSDIEVHDRLREFYDNGDFSHAEMAELFNFDPDNYEHYDYDYDYEEYA